MRIMESGEGKVKGKGGEWTCYNGYNEGRIWGVLLEGRIGEAPRTVIWGIGSGKAEMWELQNVQMSQGEKESKG